MHSRLSNVGCCSPWEWQDACRLLLAMGVDCWACRDNELLWSMSHAMMVARISCREQGWRAFVISKEVQLSRTTHDWGPSLVMEGGKGPHMVDEYGWNVDWGMLGSSTCSWDVSWWRGKWSRSCPMAKEGAGKEPPRLWLSCPLWSKRCYCWGTPSHGWLCLHVADFYFFKQFFNCKFIDRDK